MALRRFLFQQYAEPFHEEAALTDALMLTKVTIRGVPAGEVGIDLSGTRVINVASPDSPIDVANKEYVDSVIRDGLSVHRPVSAASVGNIDLLNPTAIDGYPLLDGHRFLLKDQTNPAENGVYVVAGSSLVRAVDGVDPFLKGGDYFYVLSGEENLQSAWVLYTDPPIVTGTTPLDFRQFSGLGQSVAGYGLTKDSNKFDVGDGDGIEVSANAIAVGLDVHPAIQMPNGHLSFLPDSTRGLNKDAVGAFVQIGETYSALRYTADGSIDLKPESSGSGLQIGPNGLGVKIADANQFYFQLGFLRLSGVPKNFKIEGVPTSDFVTATNLGTLTSGENADNLHSHSPPPELPEIIERWTLETPVQKGQGVYISSPGKLSAASCLTPITARCIGVAGADGYQGDTIPVFTYGIVQGILTGAPIGSRCFISHLGNPVNIALIPKGTRLVQVGIALNETDLFVYLHDYGTHSRDYATHVVTSMGETITTISGEEVLT
jgi:hypothetical protein